MARSVLRISERVQLAVHFINITDFSDTLFNNPETFGTLNAKTNSKGVNITETPCLQNLYTGVPVVCSNPQDYAFWDPYHPTTKIHQFLADFVVRQLRQQLGGSGPKGNLKEGVSEQNNHTMYAFLGAVGIMIVAIGVSAAFKRRRSEEVTPLL